MRIYVLRHKDGATAIISTIYDAVPDTLPCARLDLTRVGSGSRYIMGEPIMRYLPLVLAIPLAAAEYSAPAGIRPALRRPGAASILPGGRIISPLGHQYVTGPGPFGLAISASGKTVVSANSGPDRFSLTVMEQEKGGQWQVRQLIAPKKKNSARWQGRRRIGTAFSWDWRSRASTRCTPPKAIPGVCGCWIYQPAEPGRFTT